ncbi:DUF397 domain-containing protein [Amycolatopsis minnesotensis]|uniref:DUF397 domain-containing protein n=1 Tax=Amycolatopsis minnesotensis TaxID=337894 RepID=A0ABN2SUY2_9PSEU
MDLACARWRKSSYSSGSGSNGACVEVAFAGSAAIAVRDSKAPRGGLLTLDRQAWSAFTASAGGSRMP